MLSFGFKIFKIIFNLDDMAFVAKREEGTIDLVVSSLQYQDKRIHYHLDAVYKKAKIRLGCYKSDDYFNQPSGIIKGVPHCNEKASKACGDQTLKTARDLEKRWVKVTIQGKTIQEREAHLAQKKAEANDVHILDKVAL